MFFPFGESVVRVRRREVPDPYSGDVALGDWDSAGEVTIPGAYVSQSSSARSQTATRTQVLESKSLFCPPGADVTAADRIRVGAAVYEVDGVPAADVNPFTGWQPVQEIPLERVVG